MRRQPRRLLSGGNRGSLLWKDDFTAIEILAEIYRNCEAAMRRAFCRVVAMWPEVSFVFGGVTGNEIALDACRCELMDLFYLRHDAAPNVRGEGLAFSFVGEKVVPSALLQVVMDQARAAVDFAHHARQVAVSRLIACNQLAAGLMIKHVLEDDHGRLYIQASDAARG